MDNQPFFTPTHCVKSNGAVCRIIHENPRDEVLIEFINGMQSRVASTEIEPIKDICHVKNNRN